MVWAISVSNLGATENKCRDHQPGRPIESCFYTTI